MQVLNVRLGFATNSSSSHSIIIAGTNKSHQDSNGNEYGWDWFLLDKREDKKQYVAQQMYGTLVQNVGGEIASIVCESVFGPSRYALESGYVDHQSTWTIPTDFEGRPVITFFKEMCQRIMDDESIHIEGGNDNSDDEGGGKQDPRWDWLSDITETSSANLRVRKQNGIWTLMNVKSGLKVHLNFAGEVKAATYRPTTPELIDLKITDYCPMGCSYCYQDSTEKGQHAKLEDLRSAFWSMRQAEVFEVAMGGGEPTMHPNFIEILEAANEAGITANFTTKSLAWFKDKDIVAAVKKYAGGFAFSVESAVEAKKVQAAYDKYFKDCAWNGPKLSFQYILDAFPMENFLEVIKEAAKSYGTAVTLLGYKEVGRGGKRPFTNADFLKEILKLKEKNERYPTIGIDTVIATQYEKQLKESGISDTLFYKEEGRFSMYVDAVEKKYGKSSFTNEYKEYKHSEYIDAFGAWHV